MEESAHLGEAGMRLDLFLRRAHADLSRTHIQRLILEGRVLVDGRCEKPNFKLRGGEQILVSIPEPEPLDVVAEDIPLDILYEDEDFIVLNKARGMVVHPAAGVYHGTVVNALLSHCEDLSGINGVLRPGIVHRLDKDTSGVMVIAKNDAAHIELAEQIKEKVVKRIYWAIVCGNLKASEGRIEGNIARHKTDRKRMAVVAEGGKSAVTHFKVRERFGTHTLVECRLETGRTHQIRVHMAYIGHPLLEDPKYGKSTTAWKITGQALHSLHLELFHPRTKEPMEFEAPLPKDMEEILRILRCKSKLGEQSR